MGMLRKVEGPFGESFGHAFGICLPRPAVAGYLVAG